MSLHSKENNKSSSIMSLSSKERQLVRIDCFAQQRIFFAQQRVFAVHKKRLKKVFQKAGLKKRKYSEVIV